MRYRFCWIVAFWGLIFEGASTDAIGIPLDLSAILGSVTVEQEQRQRYNIQPSIRIGDLSAAFDLEIFLDHEGRIRDSGWDFSSRRKGVENLLRKIHYVRYGDIDDRNRRLSLYVGALEWLTLGTGLVMRNYRNTHGSPGIKRAGLDVRIRHIFRRLTVRAVIGNLLDLEGGGPVFGARAEFQPVPLLDMGVTAVVDADQLSGLPDSIRADLPRDAFAAASVDMGYPFIDRRHLRARLYAGAGRILDEDSGTGLALPGVMVDVGPARLQADYRWVNGRFQAGHFGYGGYYNARSHVAVCVDARGVWQCSCEILRHFCGKWVLSALARRWRQCTNCGRSRGYDTRIFETVAQNKKSNTS